MTSLSPFHDHTAFVIEARRSMTVADYSLGGLFLSAFLSSTILPGGSEVVLGTLVAQQTHNSLTLLAVATVGNTLGGMTTWLLGLLISWRLPLSNLTQPNQLRAVQRLKDWGSPILLLSWVPIIGDPLCLAAGWLRINGLLALCLIGLGKALRYAVIIFAIQPG